ncbi:hypothetical protein OESDEN_22979 [Oesophagostomum dentatum]|uniref:ECSIT C-terminal domain-containing protein n=1 Tax=Oesophagostomum dentatum TaxID=61180 RepID=A0A0B1S0G6_OESDE|nr:hypothetical protein OESDEN_22979 [Oesophagostomum dentatum]
MMSRDPGTELSLSRFQVNCIAATDRSTTRSALVCRCAKLDSKDLIRELKDDVEVFVDGPFRVYVMEHQVEYIVMTCAPTNPSGSDFKHEEFEEDFSNWFTEWKQQRSQRKRSVHEQKDETILAMGALYKNDNETASLWLERLHEENPSLKRLKTRLRSIDV